MQRENNEAAKHIFMANSPDNLFMTDFSLHSIGVFLFQRNKHETYEHFVRDLIIRTGIGVIGLDSEDVLKLARISKRFKLDFDDAYQYVVAEKYGLQILSFDADFDRTEKGRKIPGFEKVRIVLSSRYPQTSDGQAGCFLLDLPFQLIQIATQPSSLHLPAASNDLTS